MHKTDMPFLCKEKEGETRMNTIMYVGEHSCANKVQWHCHDHWELVYCTGGEGVFQLQDGVQINYKAGDSVAIPPKVMHTNVSRYGFTNIHMRMADPSFSDRVAFRVGDDEGGHLKIAFSQAKYYFQADIRKRELVLGALGELIVSYLVVYRADSEFSAPVKQIRNMIIRDYAKPNFALDEAIRSMPFHYDYLRKLFKKEVGLNPLEYMTKLRMKKAETMLGPMWAKGNSIADVAELCGFDDALYFSRVFKKHFGCSPSAFIKNYSNRKGEGHEENFGGIDFFQL